MNAILFALSRLNLLDVFFLLKYAVQNIENNPEQAVNDFTPSGLLKIKEINNFFTKEFKEFEEHQNAKRTKLGK